VIGGCLWKGRIRGRERMSTRESGRKEEEPRLMNVCLGEVFINEALLFGGGY
jgi:hypothetical protein